MPRRFATPILLLLLATNAGAQTFSELAPPTGPGAAEPLLFATKDAVLLSWLEPVFDSDRVAVRFARLTAGKWSGPHTVVERNDLFVNWADFPSIVEDAKGTLFAHWLQRSGGETYAYDVRMSTSSDGGQTWSPPFLLNRDGRKNEHGFVSLAPLPKGGVAATWLDGRNMPEGKEEGDMTLRYATIDARGSIHSDVQLDGRTCECCATGMTMATSGPVIVYRDRSPKEVRDIAVVRGTAKGWTRPRLLHADGWKIAGCPVNGPQIAAAGNHLGAAWFTAANDHGRVYAAFSFDGGASFGEPVRVDDGRPLGRVDIVMIDPRTAIVTWLEQTPAGGEIRARRVFGNGRVDPAIKVADTGTARAAGFPRTAALGRDVYFAWTEQNASARRVHVARAVF